VLGGSRNPNKEIDIFSQQVHRPFTTEKSVHDVPNTDDAGNDTLTMETVNC
jgi:hypothetical protein